MASGWYYRVMQEKLDKHFIKDYLQRHKYCVIATVSAEGKPEAALVAFSESDNLEIIFGTSMDSRKFADILGNPNIAVVIGWEDQATMQYEGAARVLEDSEWAALSHKHLTKQPASANFQDSPDERYIAVTPKWIRYVEKALD